MLSRFAGRCYCALVSSLSTADIEPRGERIQRSFVESLEARTFLSAEPTLAAGVGASAGLLHLQNSEAPAAALHAPASATKAATRSILNVRGKYRGTLRCSTGETGTIYVAITSQKGTALTGRVYSSDLGGFDVKFTAAINASRRMVVKGKNSDFQVRDSKNTVSADGRTITGSWSVLQMGIAFTGDVTLTKTTKLPPARPGKAPKITGTYEGYTLSGGYRDDLSVKISRQSGGHVWASFTSPDGSAHMTGIILSNGRFRWAGRFGSGQVQIAGAVKPGGRLEGVWLVKESGGQDSGTFVVNR